MNMSPEDKNIEIESTSKTRGKIGGWWRPVLLIVLVIAVLILARVFGLGERLGQVQEWLKDLGALGYLVFVLLYIVATIAAIPGSALTVAAGVLFGSVVGVILVSIASTTGASFAFLIARYFARDTTARWLSRNEKFKRLDQLTEEHGAIIVAITRLVPIFPFNLLNYGFGLTKIRFWTYVFWSWLCMIPGTVLYVVGAAAVTKAVSEGRIPWVLIVAVVVALIILMVLIRLARRKLKEKEKVGDKKEGKL